MFNKLNFHYVKKEKKKPLPLPDIFEKIINLGYFVERFKNNIYLNDRGIDSTFDDEYSSEIDREDISFLKTKIQSRHLFNLDFQLEPNKIVETIIHEMDVNKIEVDQTEVLFSTKTNRTFIPLDFQLDSNKINVSSDKTQEEVSFSKTSNRNKSSIELDFGKTNEIKTDDTSQNEFLFTKTHNKNKPSFHIDFQLEKDKQIETGQQDQYKQKDESKGIIETVKNKIEKIHFVYQSFYKNRSATGFGDFIRGSYFILQFCEKYNFSLEITVAHPLHKFLKKTQYNLNTSILSNIKFYDEIFKNSQVNKQFQKDFFYHLNNISITDECGKNSVHVYSNAFTINKDLSNNHKEKMREILEPVDLVNEKISSVLSSLHLKKKDYIVIHIRYGDSSLVTKESINVNKVKLLHREIINLSLFHLFPEKILLISDSIELKKHLVKQLPMKCLFNDITHLGEGIYLESQDDKMFNTLVDFFLISNAKHVFSFSFYEHGSGFSEWAAKTYDVPYRCKYLRV